MDQTLKYIKHPYLLHITHGFSRNISKYISKDKSSKAIRESFINFFVNDCNHNFVRSSPVIPLHDSSVPFVNAGMNQFKGIFLGTQSPLYANVANSQKCVRVGGKHNDLSVIGLDGYHHTFFEMLGNWSFGKCLKEEAIGMAWHLLTEKYKIPKDILYVTYFGGDVSLGLQSDLECKHIWRSIGVPEHRILAFGTKDNFWEMGATGPCGSCTEIHVDRLGTSNRSKFVNKGLQDLTELWNIVFIQYNRNEDGSIQPLPESHVDTGMGFERLTALLQGKMSNYDTDLFTSIFEGIAKICKSIPKYGGQFGESDWNHLDTSYRILADHARMITVCLADGVIPDQNQKLRRIMRKAFVLSETSFQKEQGLLKELSNYVVESLGVVYPELESNINQVHDIISYEEDVYKLLRKNSLNEWQKVIRDDPKLADLDIIEIPGLMPAYKEIKSLPNDVISSKFAFKLYDTYGLDKEIISKLSHALNFKFSAKEFDAELESAKIRSREQVILNSNEIINQLQKENVPQTDDQYKYKYLKEEGTYKFPALEVQLLKIVCNNVIVSDLVPNVNCDVLLDKSNLYTQAGGQINDRGFIRFGDDLFEINKAEKTNGYVLHRGILKSNNVNTVPINSIGVVEIDNDFRVNCMRNHTATHLVNNLLKQFKSTTCQKSSKVTSKYLNFDVGIFGSKLSVDDIAKIEEEVCRLIKEGVDVVTYEIDSQELHEMSNVICVPGEIYPSTGIRLIEIIASQNFQSREPCCGTHVTNTSDLIDFCFIGLQSLGRTTTSLHAVTGSRAELAKRNGCKLLNMVNEMHSKINDYVAKPKALDMAIAKVNESLKYDMNSDMILPVTDKHKIITVLNNIKHQIREMQKEFIEAEMQTVLNQNREEVGDDKKFIVHYLECSRNMDSLQLHKATKLCRNFPVLVISYIDDVVKARCCIPQNMVNEHFTAEKWLNSSVGTIFKCVSTIAKGQDAASVCNMKSKKVDNKNCDILLEKSIEAAKSYAKQHLK